MILKKAGIITGAVVGGTVGGTITLIGKLTKNKFVEEVGESIVDSALLTGEIAGTAVQGAMKAMGGMITDDQTRLEDGLSEMKGAGGQVVGNFVGNLNMVKESGVEILHSVKNRDLKQATKGARRLVKMISVGAIAVGPIKIKEEQEEEE